MNVVQAFFPCEKFAGPENRAVGNGIPDEFPGQKLDFHAETMDPFLSSTEVLHVIAFEPFLCLLDLGV